MQPHTWGERPIQDGSHAAGRREYGFSQSLHAV